MQVHVAKEMKTGSGPGLTPPGKSVRWSGTVPPQKWMNFYTKVISKHASNADLRLTVGLEVPVASEEASNREQDLRSGFRYLDLNDDVSIP